MAKVAPAWRTLLIVAAAPSRAARGAGEDLDAGAGAGADAVAAAEVAAAEPSSDAAAQSDTPQPQAKAANLFSAGGVGLLQTIRGRKTDARIRLMRKEFDGTDLEASSSYLYSDQGLQRREALRRSREIGAVIDAWWRSILPPPAYADADADPQLGKLAYYRVFLPVYFALLPEATAADARPALAADWASDSHGKGRMRSEDFFFCAFALADMWCETLAEAEYVAFLENARRVARERPTLRVRGMIAEVLRGVEDDPPSASEVAAAASAAAAAAAAAATEAPAPATPPATRGRSRPRGKTRSAKRQRQTREGAAFLPTAILMEAEAAGVQPGALRPAGCAASPRAAASADDDAGSVHGFGDGEGSGGVDGLAANRGVPVAAGGCDNSGGSGAGASPPGREHAVYPVPAVMSGLLFHETQPKPCKRLRKLAALRRHEEVRRRASADAAGITTTTTSSSSAALNTVAAVAAAATTAAAAADAVGAPQARRRSSTSLSRRSSSRGGDGGGGSTDMEALLTHAITSGAVSKAVSDKVASLVLSNSPETSEQRWKELSLAYSVLQSPHADLRLRHGASDFLGAGVDQGGGGVWCGTDVLQRRDDLPGVVLQDAVGPTARAGVERTAAPRLEDGEDGGKEGEAPEAARRRRHPQAALHRTSFDGLLLNGHVLQRSGSQLGLLEDSGNSLAVPPRVGSANAAAPSSAVPVAAAPLAASDSRPPSSSASSRAVLKSFSMECGLAADERPPSAVVPGSIRVQLRPRPSTEGGQVGRPRGDGQLSQAAAPAPAAPAAASSATVPIPFVSNAAAEAARHRAEEAPWFHPPLRGSGGGGGGSGLNCSDGSGFAQRFCAGAGEALETAVGGGPKDVRNAWRRRAGRDGMSSRQFCLRYGADPDAFRAWLLGPNAHNVPRRIWDQVCRYLYQEPPLVDRWKARAKRFGVTPQRFAAAYRINMGRMLEWMETGVSRTQHLTDAVWDFLLDGGDPVARERLKRAGGPQPTRSAEAAAACRRLRSVEEIDVCGEAAAAAASAIGVQQRKRLQHYSTKRLKRDGHHLEKVIVRQGKHAASALSSLKYLANADLEVALQ